MGTHFANDTLARGARKVYATARNPRPCDDARIVPFTLDVTHTAEEIRTNVETNFLGPLFLARALAPILSADGESVIIDIHSAMSWYAVGGLYSATKAGL
ncbi:SDR family NAD(P)-dependent oxidoreductase [Arthrobacter sp.]|uniref:SDR family NAD(P)-dependent oxidoreductase n=1 Tax=Arthrobacter sp. TaxID=1667 RepID=UPI0039C8BCE3